MISPEAGKCLEIAGGLHLIHGHRETDPKAYDEFVYHVLMLDEAGDTETLQVLQAALAEQWLASEAISACVRMGLTTEALEAQVLS